MTRKVTVVEVIYSILLLAVGIFFTVKGSYWGMPIMTGVLTLQNIKNYQFYRSSGDKRLYPVARSHQRTAIVLGSCTVVIIVMIILFG